MFLTFVAYYVHSEYVSWTFCLKMKLYHILNWSLYSLRISVIQLSSEIYTVSYYIKYFFFQKDFCTHYKDHVSHPRTT